MNHNPVSLPHGSSEEPEESVADALYVPTPEPMPASEGESYSLDYDFEHFPRVKYLVDSLIYRRMLAIVYGAPGSLKSMLLADMAVCIAAGLPWLPPTHRNAESWSAFQTVQCPVLWIDYEKGEYRTDNRFAALGRSRGLPEDTPIHCPSMPSPWLDASQDKHIDNLIERVKYYEYGLVVIDNLEVISGRVKENSAGMTRVMGNLRRLAEETDTAVIVIHDQAKSSGVNSRKGEPLRGHSSIEAALDLALVVEREEGGPNITLTATKVRRTDVEPFGAIFAYEHSWNGDLDWACFYGTRINLPW